jgi:hypothetical protein
VAARWLPSLRLLSIFAAVPPLEASRLCFRCLYVKERRDKPPSLKAAKGKRSAERSSKRETLARSPPVVLCRPFRAPVRGWHGSAGRCPGLSWVAPLGLGDSSRQGRNIPISSHDAPFEPQDPPPLLRFRREVYEPGSAWWSCSVKMVSMSARRAEMRAPPVISGLLWSRCAIPTCTRDGMEALRASRIWID